MSPEPGYDFATRAELDEYLRVNRNWGRWGDDEELGTINLITPEKRAAAAKLVRTGQAVSLSRPLPKDPSPINPKPAAHYMEKRVRAADAGFSIDYIAIGYHGRATTHLDALCHTWQTDGMYNGRDPDKEIGFLGASWGQVDAWKEGMITRGVLLDVARHRGKPYVTFDEPVHGSELRDIAAAQGVEVQPGDALIVYSGRERHDATEPELWGGAIRPGLHASCMRFLRSTDTAVLIWDMLDLQPNGLDHPWNIHAAIWAFGLALIDNAELGELAALCDEQKRYEFLLCVAPLRLQGGTGSPVNPIAVL